MFHAFSYDLQITLELLSSLCPGLILFSQVLSIVLSKTSFERMKANPGNSHYENPVVKQRKFCGICNVIIQ